MTETEEMMIIGWTGDIIIGDCQKENVVIVDFQRGDMTTEEMQMEGYLSSRIT